MQVAVLAGGQATRLGHLTADQPKSLVKIGGRPFLEYQLGLLHQAGIEDVVLCVGHLGEQIAGHFGDGKRYGMRIRYSSEDTPLGTAGALKNAEAFLSDTFFCMYGDSYLPIDFASVMRYFHFQSKLALMTVYRNNNLYDQSNTAIQGNLVDRYSKTQKSSDMVYIDYGASLFRKEVLALIPESCFYSLEDLFSRLIASQELLAFEVRERFHEIGSPSSLKEFEEYVGREG